MPASVDEYRGTWTHMAPELLHPRKFGLPYSRVSVQADIYPFGTLVYEVLTGRSPSSVEGFWQEEFTLHIIEGRRPSKPDKAGDIGFGGRQR